jgi:ketosteroid isomerase-like protein
MSEKNFAVVERLYALFASRDVAAAIPDYAAPNLELRVPPLYPDTPEVFRGREGIERWMRMIDEAWAEWRLEPERYLDAGSTVVVLARLIAEGGSSGIHLEREVAHVWTLEQGRAVSIRVYLDQAEALEAVGLSEAPSE